MFAAQPLNHIIMFEVIVGILVVFICYQLDKKNVDKRTRDIFGGRD